MGVVPEAAALRVTEPPCTTCWLNGCNVKTGWYISLRVTGVLLTVSKSSLIKPCKNLR